MYNLRFCAIKKDKLYVANIIAVVSCCMLDSDRHLKKVQRSVILIFKCINDKVNLPTPFK